LPQGKSESFAKEIVRRLEVAAKIRRDEDNADEQASDEVPDGKLKEVHVALERESGNADERERARFTGNDGKSDRPPGHLFAAKEIVA
jgi:hypothetical protein